MSDGLARTLAEGVRDRGADVVLEAAATNPLSGSDEIEHPSSGLVRFAADHPLMLECQQTLAPFQIAYMTYGTLNREKSNAILVCHALTGDQRFFLALLSLEDGVPYLHLPGVPAAAEAWLVEPRATGDPFTWKKRVEFGLAAGQWTSLE